jgi:hypothetical protein
VKKERRVLLWPDPALYLLSCFFLLRLRRRCDIRRIYHILVMYTFSSSLPWIILKLPW